MSFLNGPATGTKKIDENTNQDLNAEKEIIKEENKIEEKKETLSVPKQDLTTKLWG